jgi:hypothetical protein
MELAGTPLNAILEGIEVPASGTPHNPVVYPELPPTGPQGLPLASVSIPAMPVQIDIPRLIGGVFQRIDALQQMLLSRIEAMEARLDALEKRLPN